MALQSRLRVGAQVTGEIYLLLAWGVGLGVVTWGMQALVLSLTASPAPDLLGLLVAGILFSLGGGWWLPHAIVLRVLRRQRALLGTVRSTWGCTPNGIC